MMHEKIHNLLISSDIVQGPDGIYTAPIAEQELREQVVEREFRERVAALEYVDYFATIAKHHSISVMDCEVDRFLDRMAKKAVILDIGGVLLLSGRMWEF